MEDNYSTGLISEKILNNLDNNIIIQINNNSLFNYLLELYENYSSFFNYYISMSCVFIIIIILQGVINKSKK